MKKVLTSRSDFRKFFNQEAPYQCLIANHPEFHEQVLTYIWHFLSNVDLENYVKVTKT